MNLSENIFRLRTQKGLSQEELARALDLSRREVSDWEGGIATPALEKLIELSEAFGVSIDELVYGVAEAGAFTERRSVQASYSICKVIGAILLGVGITSLLLLIFGRDTLTFGDGVEKLLSVAALLASVVLLAPYNFKALYFGAVIHFIYSFLCFGIFDISEFYNDLLIFLSSVVLLVWFIALGLHNNKIYIKKEG